VKPPKGHCICGQPRPCEHLDEGVWFEIAKEGCYRRLFNGTGWQAPMLADGSMNTDEDSWAEVEDYA
jgi:hypothetical protein